MNKPKEYKIETVQDFLLVPEDRLDECLHEFRDYLDYARTVSEMAKLVGSVMGAKDTNTNVGSYNWTDDGIRKATLIIQTKLEKEPEGAGIS